MLCGWTISGPPGKQVLWLSPAPGSLPRPSSPPRFLPGKPLSVHFSSVTQSCPTLCNPVNHSTPGLPVHHQLPESTQTRARRVGDAIQPSPFTPFLIPGCVAEAFRACARKQSQTGPQPGPAPHLLCVCGQVSLLCVPASLCGKSC